MICLGRERKYSAGSNLGSQIRTFSQNPKRVHHTPGGSVLAQRVLSTGNDAEVALHEALVCNT